MLLQLDVDQLATASPQLVHVPPHSDPRVAFASDGGRARALLLLLCTSIGLLGLWRREHALKSAATN